MAHRKIIIYQKNSTKPIVLSDKDIGNDQMSMLALTDLVTKMLNTPFKICKFITQDDFVTMKTEEIAGFMISSPGGMGEVIKGATVSIGDVETDDSTEDEPENEYATELVIDDE